MATYKVLSNGTVTRSEIFNPSPGQILKEFEIPSPIEAFSPLTYLTDGRAEEVQRLDAETKAEAEEWLNQNRHLAIA